MLNVKSAVAWECWREGASGDRGVEKVHFSRVKSCFCSVILVHLTSIGINWFTLDGQHDVINYTEPGAKRIHHNTQIKPALGRKMRSSWNGHSWSCPWWCWTRYTKPGRELGLQQCDWNGWFMACKIISATMNWAWNIPVSLWACPSSCWWAQELYLC